LLLISLSVRAITLPGSMGGLNFLFNPDFSKINAAVILGALGQAFFSLSIGMGALITYGSYLKKNQNIMESAAYVTVFDIFIAFVAGMLVIPAMYVALAQGIAIFGEEGELISSVSLVFTVLPQLFENLGGVLGLVVSISFFLLLGLAALTSSISLLEVPVSYVIDEHNIPRKKASLMVGGVVLVFALVISFDIELIDYFVYIFNEIGLPLGGMMTCIFLGWVWKTGNALTEIDLGYPMASTSRFGKVWAFFIKYVCPILIGIVFVTTVLNIIR